MLKHVNDKAYIEDFLGQENDPLLWKFRTYGDANYKKALYVIPENGNGWGFFAELRVLLVKLHFADRYGLVPYLQWGKNFSYSETEAVNGTYNAYEYYFNQPFITSKEEVYASRLVTIAKASHASFIDAEYKNEKYDVSEEYLNDMATTYAKYIRLNDTVQKKTRTEIEKLLGDKKTLGVHFRGTDFHIGFKNHPIEVQLSQEIEQAKKGMEKGFEQIFLATDEIKAINEFEKAFGDKLVYFEDVYRGASNESIAFSNDSRALHKYRLGYEVLRDVLTLAKCQGLIAGLSNVGNFTRIIKKSYNENYEYLDIINNGINKAGIKFSQRNQQMGGLQ